MPATTTSASTLVDGAADAAALSEPTAAEIAAAELDPPGETAIPDGRVCVRVLRPVLLRGERQEPGALLRVPRALAAELTAANKAHLMEDL